MGLTQSSSWGSVRVARGYQIMRVQPNSITTPGSAEPVRFVNEDDTFVKLIQANLERPLTFHIFNVVDNGVRNVRITPSERWGGSGLLGMSVKFERIQDLSGTAWRVLTVKARSPGAQAGLIPESDYIIGTDVNQFVTDDDLDDILRENMDKSVILVVYNSVYERTREAGQVKVCPSFDWGGSGSMGCDIGNGYLHQIPPRKRTMQQTQTSVALKALQESESSRGLPPSLGSGQSVLPPSLADSEGSSAVPKDTMPPRLGETAAPASDHTQTVGNGSLAPSANNGQTLEHHAGKNEEAISLTIATYDE